MTTETKELQKRSENALEMQTVDLQAGNLPDLEKADVMPVDLTGNYWTPEQDGESKRLFFVDIQPQKVLSSSGNGEIIDLDCAVFLEQKGNDIKTVTNGSRRLVGVLESYLVQGLIGQGTPLLITYLGKRRNKTNSFSSDNWSIKPLRISI